MIEETFKKRGLKLTKQRKLIYNIISKGSNVTLKDIEKECLNKLNITTIYRIIDIFLEKEIISKKIGFNKDVYYEITPIEHTHYIKCVKCHKKTKIDSKDIEEFEQKVSKNYVLLSHDIEFNGICKKCSIQKD